MAAVAAVAAVASVAAGRSAPSVRVAAYHQRSMPPLLTHCRAKYASTNSNTMTSWDNDVAGKGRGLSSSKNESIKKNYVEKLSKISRALPAANDVHVHVHVLYMYQYVFCYE